LGAFLVTVTWFFPTVLILFSDHLTACSELECFSALLLRSVAASAFSPVGYPSRVTPGLLKPIAWTLPDRPPFRQEDPPPWLDSEHFPPAANVMSFFLRLWTDPISCCAVVVSAWTRSPSLHCNRRSPCSFGFLEKEKAPCSSVGNAHGVRAPCSLRTLLLLLSPPFRSLFPCECLSARPAPPRSQLLCVTPSGPSLSGFVGGDPPFSRFFLLSFGLVFSSCCLVHGFSVAFCVAVR